MLAGTGSMFEKVIFPGVNELLRSNSFISPLLLFPVVFVVETGEVGALAVIVGAVGVGEDEPPPPTEVEFMIIPPPPWPRAGSGVGVIGLTETITLRVEDAVLPALSLTE